MEPKAGVWSRLRASLARTQERLAERLGGALDLPAKLDDATVAELEEALIAADLGVATTALVIERMKERVRRHDVEAEGRLRELLASEIARLLAEAPAPPADSYPRVTLVVGVNGAGKTTSIAKLARHLQQQGLSVMLGAGDTFRAAAVEQLTLWAGRLGIPIVKQATGADPAAVAFDAVSAAIARKIDYLLLDTAGRLHTQKNLMTELEKIVRVVKKQVPDAPHETLLVLDGTTGQNAIRQAGEFAKVAPITGLLLTKMDGTAKGGAMFGIREVLPVPIKFLGVGEGMDDLEPFTVKDYVDAILQEGRATSA